MTDAIGLYVHIPFCVKKCNYCDFCSFPTDSKQKSEYVDALIEEILTYKRSPRIRVDTVFFGGGTPSLLDADEIERIVKAIKSAFALTDGSEFTVEVNPGTVSLDKLLAIKAAGVNRLSIGFQTKHENELKMLGRIHNYEDFIQTFNSARSLGFDNINVDIMYGIPHQTLSSFEETLTAITELSPEHISCYGLIVEPKTPFYDMKDTLPLPDEDTECDMYELACKLLGLHGYEHYEISNYSKKGFQCKHNLKYWHDEEYIGVGLSAHSYYHGERIYTTSDIKEYFSKNSANYRYGERTRGRDAFEYAMLALRLTEGLSLRDYESVFGVPFTRGRETVIKKYADAGLLKATDSSISLTEKGFYLSNTILSELI